MISSPSIEDIFSMAMAEGGHPVGRTENFFGVVLYCHEYSSSVIPMSMVRAAHRALILANPDFDWGDDFDGFVAAVLAQNPTRTIDASA